MYGWGQVQKMAHSTRQPQPSPWWYAESRRVYDIGIITRVWSYLAIGGIHWPRGDGGGDGRVGSNLPMPGVP